MVYIYKFLKNILKQFDFCFQELKTICKFDVIGLIK